MRGIFWECMKFDDTLYAVEIYLQVFHSIEVEQKWRLMLYQGFMDHKLIVSVEKCSSSGGHVGSK